MNASLFLSTFRRNLNLFSVFTAFIILYLLMIIGMFSSNAGSDPFASMPESMRNAFGMEGNMGELTGFLASGFYGVSFVMFLMIYCIIVANQLMSSLVDRGSMAYLLSTPISRRRVATTHASVLIINLMIIAILSTIVGLTMSPILVDDARLNVPAFIQINLMGFLLFFVISAYSFLFSCLFNESKQTLAATGILSLLFYGAHLVSNMNAELDWLRYITVLSAFQPAEITAGAFDVWPASVAMGISGIVLYSIAVWIFSKRDLPL
ncbi:MAG: transporter permease [Sporolactobacillus laevolacticus]|jgi:ABC-2 type transport system permease protein|nr:transporter permease [Sporolactobacillus laevolacticus]